MNYVEGRWQGTLTTKAKDWRFNLTRNQASTVIAVLTGINEGTLLLTSGC